MGSIKHLAVLLAIFASLYLAYMSLSQLNVEGQVPVAAPVHQTVYPGAKSPEEASAVLEVEPAIFVEEWHGFVLFRPEVKIAFVKTTMDPLDQVFTLSQDEVEVKGKTDGRSTVFPVPKEFSSVIFEAVIDKDGIHALGRHGNCQFEVPGEMVYLGARDQERLKGTVYRLDIGPSEDALVRSHCYSDYRRDPAKGTVSDVSVKPTKPNK